MGNFLYKYFQSDFENQMVRRETFEGENSVSRRVFVVQEMRLGRGDFIELASDKKKILIIN